MTYYNLILVIIIFAVIMAVTSMTLQGKSLFGLSDSHILVFFLMLMLLVLWYEDVLTIGMGIHGFLTKGGLYQIMDSKTPAFYLFAINGASMLVISILVLLKFGNRGFNLWSWILLFGVLFFLIVSFYIAKGGMHSIFLGLPLIDIYHFLLPFIIVPAIVIALTSVKG